jgi:hypothetical protein
MNPKAVFRAVIFALGWGLVASPAALADDSAAAIAAGGLVARRETRIVMAREVLQISVKKIVVDYDFRNDTDQDVTTEVAFPVPPYTNGIVEGPAPEEQSFQNFKLWVNGQPAHYDSQATATLKGKDVTGILRANHIDVATFGHFDWVESSNHESKPISQDLSRLPKPVRDNLVRENLFDGDGPDDSQAGLWTVHLQYHWTQTFPAHSTVHIRHEYSPVVGFEMMPRETIDLFLMTANERQAAKFKYPPPPQDLKFLGSFCPKISMLHGIQQKLNDDNSSGDHSVFPQWVDFILTSANTWKRPIEDFTLIIERPKPEHGGKVFINFCPPANGEVEKTDVDLFQLHLTNFVPVSELHIGFFDVPQAKAAQPEAK